MLTEYNKQRNIGIGCGLILQIAGLWVKSPTGMDEALSAIFIISGYSLFAWGCWLYAKSKGYNGAWGLLGLFNIVGLIGLYFLKDKSNMKRE